MVLDPEEGVEVLQEQGHRFIHHQVSQIVLNKLILQDYHICSNVPNSGLSWFLMQLSITEV